MEKHYSKYDFHDDKVELCQGLTAEKLKELGFTNFNPTTWYFCRTISSKDYPGGDRFSESLNISIGIDFKTLDVEILDDAFLQPSLSYVEYYLKERPFEDCSLYVQNGIRVCNGYIKFLVDNNVIKFKEVS